MIDPKDFDCPTCLRKRGQPCDGVTIAVTMGEFHEERRLETCLALALVERDELAAALKRLNELTVEREALLARREAERNSLVLSQKDVIASVNDKLNQEYATSKELGRQVAQLIAERNEIVESRDEWMRQAEDAVKRQSDALDRTVVQTSSPKRRRLPEEREAKTQVFRLAYFHKDGSPDVMHFYLTAGLYEDGGVGEVFLKADKTGTLASGLLDALGVCISLLLQYGVPLEVIAHKFRHARFPPSGATKNPEFPQCASPLDLLAQWLLKRFGREES